MGWMDWKIKTVWMLTHLAKLKFFCLCPNHSGSDQSGPYKKLLAATGVVEVSL